MSRVDTLLERPWWLPDDRVRLDAIRWEQKLEIQVLRDDLLHPVASGNKVRKLDAWLPLLRDRGITDVVTCGGMHSAHCAAVAALAHEAGLRPHLLLRGEAPPAMTGYTLLSHMLAELRWVEHAHWNRREALLQEHAASLRAQGRQVAIIPEGGSARDALYGLVRLVRGLAIALDRPWDRKWRLVVDSGTGTTAIGLALGIALLELPWEVHAVCLVPNRPQDWQDASARLLASWAEVEQPPRKTPQILWNERSEPRPFGKVRAQDLDRCRAIAQETGLLLDPVYTLAGWDHLQGFSTGGLRDTVLLHTGGQWNLFGAAQRVGWPPAPTGA